MNDVKEKNETMKISESGLFFLKPAVLKICLFSVVCVPALLSGHLFSIMSARPLPPKPDNIKIGAYYTPWHASSSSDFYILNGTNTGIAVERAFKEIYYDAYWLHKGMTNYMRAKNPEQYRETFHADNDVRDIHGNTVPFSVIAEELEIVHGTFPTNFAKLASYDYYSNSWRRIKGMIALKKKWQTDPSLYTNYNYIPTDFAVFPEPLPDAAGGIGFNDGFYDAEDRDLVIAQKKLAAEYGIDYFAMEWYWSHDSHNETSGNSETIEFKTDPLNTFFFETPPEGDLKLALYWVIQANRNGVSKGHVQDFTSNTVSTLVNAARPYFRNSQYLRDSSGKLVFFLYSTDNLINTNVPGHAELFKERIQQLQNEVTAEFPEGITLILAPRCHPPYKTIFENAGITNAILRAQTWATCRNYDEYRSNMLSVLSNEAARCAGFSFVPGVYMAHHTENVTQFGSALYRQNQILNQNGGDYLGNFRTEYPNLDTVSGSTPEKFRQMLSSVIDYTAALNQPEKMIFIWSWNDWMKASILEPTTLYGYEYLDAVAKVRTAGGLQFERRNNPSAPNFNFNDNSSAGWTFTGNGWCVADCALLNTNSAAAGQSAGITAAEWTNCTITCDIKLLHCSSDTNWAGIHFRKTNPTDNAKQSGYTARVYGDGRLVLVETSTVLAAVNIKESSPLFNPLAETFRLEVKTSDDSIRVFLNGIKYIDVTDTSFQSGFSGLACENTGVRFDNFSVK